MVHETRRKDNASHLFNDDQITKKAAGYYVLNSGVYINADVYQTEGRHISEDRAVAPIIEVA